MLWLKRIAKIISVLVLSLVFFLGLMYRADIPSEELVEKYSTPQSHFIEVDGLNVHVRFMGEGDPIFLLHGSFSSLHTWDVWQKELSPYFMTISLDFPGHGLTGPDELKRYSIEDYSHLVQRIAEKLSIEKFHLAGNSMGGAVALEIATSRPDKVLSLNLIDASGAPQRAQRTVSTGDSTQTTSRPLIFRVAENPVFSKILLKCTPKFLFAKNLQEVYGDKSKVNEAAVDRYYELMLMQGNRKATLDRLSQSRRKEFDFSRLTMPTLILWGEKDSWISVSNAYSFESAILGSNLVIFPEAGHVPMEEIPTESVSEYLSFLGVEVRKNYLDPSKQLVYAD
ncbi:pimeloyl-ACP methyl ester carboxylesterase [Algoriphagus boseongensis]|uniref:Pimeloyl-ACP methyl ester carboxylesterase n=1 Tax=Algoriphagus boseongensis TaxID=1442587 RepID=A0A4R6T8Y7_9BACT|nr:alpha/beta hydrolase [Algoriphagus boseongensis]TDQ19196.1 pimeloyl-ACP methyl ester carboxylesterase [Algoriphagus boseongensis]